MEFDVIAGDPGSAVVLHVPHGGTAIPGDARSSIVLDDAALGAELLAMTDAHTDTMALAAADSASQRPWVVANRLSRLVVDPERFTDEREEMRAVGMGAVYTRTSHGAVLRADDPDHERDLVERYFEPYAAAISDLVSARLATCGEVIIVDVHSYPRVALPYERHADLGRPPVCIGADFFHTTDPMVRLAVEIFGGPVQVTINEPFVGTYVPTRFYEKDGRVRSIMIEIRRDTYLDELTGEPHAGYDALLESLTRFVDRLS